MNIVIQIVIKVGGKSFSQVRLSCLVLVDVFQKSLQFGLTFQTGGGTITESYTKERKRAVPDPTRLSKASTLLVAASLVLGIPSSREVYIRTTTTPLRVRERFLEKFSLLNGDWASDSPFNTTSSKTVSVNAVSTKKVGGFPRRTSTNQDDSLLS